MLRLINVIYVIAIHLRRFAVGIMFSLWKEYFDLNDLEGSDGKGVRDPSLHTDFENTYE